MASLAVRHGDIVWMSQHTRVTGMEMEARNENQNQSIAATGLLVSTVRLKYQQMGHTASCGNGSDESKWFARDEKPEVELPTPAGVGALPRPGHF